MSPQPICSRNSGCRRWVRDRSVGSHPPQALDPRAMEAVLQGITDSRDRALFWLIYDAGLSGQQALLIDVEDITWAVRAIRFQTSWGRPREIFFSRVVGTVLDNYLATRGQPTTGLWFITHRKAHPPGRADLTRGGYAPVLSPSGHTLEAVHARMDTSSVASYRYQCPGGQSLHGRRSQTL